MTDTPCTAALSGDGYGTCDTVGGCADCRSIAADMGDRDRLQSWRHARAAADRVAEVAAQLDREIGERLHPLASLAGPTAVAEWEASIDPERLAAQLCHDPHHLTAAETVVGIIGALWPLGDPPAEWWPTPLGSACARAGGIDGPAAILLAAALRLAR